MINPMAPQFPVHEITIEHPQVSFISRMGIKTIRVTGIDVDESNRYLTNLMQKVKYRQNLMVFLFIRMNTDRVELRIPLTRSTQLIYSDNVIQQLLLQWFIMNWRTLSQNTIFQFVQMNSDIVIPNDTGNSIKSNSISSINPIDKLFGNTDSSIDLI